MTPKLINPDLVKPLFDMSAEQPFLLRELIGYEKSLVDHWQHFYRDRIFPRGNAPSEYRDDFIKYVSNRGFRPKRLRAEHDNRDGLLFQDLFRVAPRITLLPALNRIVGLPIKLHECEVRDGFREFVALHRQESGDFPRRKDFSDASKNRFFLPQTGIIVPHPKRIQKRAAKSNSSQSSYGIGYSYEQYFDIPGEISHEDFARIASLSKHRLEDLIDNLRKVQKWMDEQSPNSPEPLTPSRVDVENYARVNKDAVPWSAYESWIYHGTQLLGGTPKGAVRSLDWIREQAGIGVERSFVRRPKSNPPGFWTKSKIANNFCEAWRCINGRGFQPSRKILADPPTAKDIESMARIQASILKQHGELVPSICEAMKVPSVQIPSVSTIKEQYPGGYQGLLADIERKHKPSGGIRFSNGVALHRMASVHRQRNASDRFTPVRVAMLAREIV